MTDDASDPARTTLRHRLATELGDEALATRVAAALDDAVTARLLTRTGADRGGADLVSYSPARVADDEVDSLWVLAFGYRLAAGPVAGDEGIPPMSALEPGPVNEALAHAAASFVARRPVPIIAQWEVARVLDTLNVDGVVSVEPDHSSDGSVVYLSTADVIAKGLRLAAEAGVDVGFAGVVGHADHAPRAVLTAIAAGLDAAVPEGIRLPADYDPESGQPWTRSREAFVPVDLMARAFTA